VTGGHFVCKFYQGAEDQALDRRLKVLFEKVHRIKPETSRKESREAYFVCLRRRAGVHRDAVFDDEG
jgi:21S rRNA (uridine2791-2'-O)-methyltransferase